MSISNTSNLETIVYFIEKFRGITCLMWSIKIEMFLCSIDNFDDVNEINPNPNPNPNLGRGDQTTFKAWTLRDDRTRFNLILHCGDVQVQTIHQLKTSKEV
jgi:hypothetical protein